MSVSLETLALAKKFTRDYVASYGGGVSGTSESVAYYDTTANWNAQGSFISERGAIYIFSDYQTLTDKDGNINYYPNIKIGDGVSVLSALPFVAAGTVNDLVARDYIDMVEQCLEAQGKLVSAQDRERWDQIGDVNAILENI